jgi:hypothetical protein
VRRKLVCDGQQYDREIKHTATVLPSISGQIASPAH